MDREAWWVTACETPVLEHPLSGNCFFLTAHTITLYRTVLLRHLVLHAVSFIQVLCSNLLRITSNLERNYLVDLKCSKYHNKCLFVCFCFTGTTWHVGSHFQNQWSSP